MKVQVRRVNLASLGKMGCLLGTVAAFLPSLVCGLLLTGLATLVRRWLEDWQTMTVSILGSDVLSFDLINLLRLEPVLETLQVVTAASALTLGLVVLGLALVSGLLLGLIIILVGLAYNLLARLTGGLVVETAPLVAEEAGPPGQVAGPP